MKIFDNNGHGRMDAPVCVIENSRSRTIIRKTTLDKLLRSLREGKKLKALTEKARSDLEEDKSAYNRIKENEIPAFLIGDFEKRTDKGCQTYVPLLVFDVDHLKSDTALQSFFSKCRKISYIFAVFPSLSGRGVRILVWTNSTPETHKACYKQLVEKLSRDLDIPCGSSGCLDSTDSQESGYIDTSTSNISRIWYMNHVEEDFFYLKETSEVVVFSAHEALTTKNSGNKDPQLLDDSEKLELCRQMARQRQDPGQRNNFCYQLACTMNEHGFTQEQILAECLTYQEDDFPTTEIQKTVNSAIELSRNGKFTDSQLLSWKRKFNSGKEARSNDDESEENEENEHRNKSTFGKIRDYLDDKYEFRYNEVSFDIEYRKKGDGPYRILNENDLLYELYELGLNGIDKKLVTILKSSYVNRYDPIREYFDTLPPWDGNTDHISHLASFVRTTDQAWFELMFRKMLVRSVACALKRIPFNKQCFTLYGRQNDGKTTFLRFLCPPTLKPYFKENLDFSGKDGLLALCQNVFINLDELSSLTRGDIKKIKDWFTKETVKERLPYDRKPSSFDRRANFLASTNSDQFLVDESGNVRWLVFEVLSICHDDGGDKGYDKNIDMDKVLAQAHALLNSGFEFMLTSEEIEKSERNNENFKVLKVEHGLIQKKFIPASKEDPGAEFMNATEIMLEIEKDNRQHIHVGSVGKALRVLGFVRTQKYIKDTKNGSGRQIRGYWVRRIS